MFVTILTWWWCEDDIKSDKLLDGLGPNGNPRWSRWHLISTPRTWNNHWLLTAITNTSTIMAIFMMIITTLACPAVLKSCSPENFLFPVISFSSSSTANLIIILLIVTITNPQKLLMLLEFALWNEQPVIDASLHIHDGAHRSLWHLRGRGRAQ